MSVNSWLRFRCALADRFSVLQVGGGAGEGLLGGDALGRGVVERGGRELGLVGHILRLLTALVLERGLLQLRGVVGLSLLAVLLQLLALERGVRLVLGKI